MTESHHQWHSDLLGMEMDLLVFGERGYPLVLFPTSMGSFRQNKDFKLIDAAQWYIDNGLVKIYTPATIDKESWYGMHLHPAHRAENHAVYDLFLVRELAPRILHDANQPKLAVAGCSFGAYHATNFAFRHPELVGYLFNMGGSFDIKPQVEGHYDDNVYYNNPVDFLPGLIHPGLHEMKIVFGTGDGDICKDANIGMSALLKEKGVPHWLDIRHDSVHDWPAWREMFPHYLSLIEIN